MSESLQVSLSYLLPLLAQAEGEEEEEGEEEGSLIEIAEEADLIQADRVIEEEEVVRPRRRKKEENGADQELAKMLLAMRLDQDVPGTIAGPEQATEEWEVNQLPSLQAPAGWRRELSLSRQTWIRLCRVWPLLLLLLHHFILTSCT